MVERRCPYCHYSMYVRKNVLDHISSQHKSEVRSDGGLDTTIRRITNLSRAGVRVVSRERLAKGLKLVNCPNDMVPVVLEYSKTILAEALVLVGDETEPNQNKHYDVKDHFKRMKSLAALADIQSSSSESTSEEEEEEEDSHGEEDGLEEEFVQFSDGDKIMTEETGSESN
ncbi:Zinc finger protein 106 [Frankliniella fusca]|uniref:Zinc finger protein 106 n=1 Tax=Frankliniella fusca TaxID=407009 RepID=A0AAE1LFA2_9NEOP|nr:Zinc finger protein 106 [Frankliniella fusca]